MPEEQIQGLDKRVMPPNISRPRVRSSAARVRRAAALSLAGREWLEPSVTDDLESDFYRLQNLM
jgi:hypothetical protein